MQPVLRLPVKLRRTAVALATAVMSSLTSLVPFAGAAVLFSLPLAAVAPTAAVEILRPVFGLPAHIVNRFADPSAAFAVSSAGTYVVLDKRDHAVYAFDATGSSVRRIIELGFETGRVLQPLALAFGSDDVVAVADSPNGFDRLQLFTVNGLRLGGFYLPVRPNPRVTIEGLVLDSGDNLGFTGRTFLVNRPEWGALFAEVDINGNPLRQIGLLRRVMEADRDVELAMNIGIPIADPTGGFFFVFQTGVPMFRKYSAEGTLLYERHIEGPELDARIRALPTTWAARAPGTKPVVLPLVRTATADRQGRLWISLTLPYTYVYDVNGDKARTIQFHAAGVLSPSSLFFTSRGRLLVGPGGYEFDVN